MPPLPRDTNAPDLSIGKAVKPRVPLADEIGTPVTTPATRVVEASRKTLRWFKGKPQVVGHFTDPQYQQHRKFGPRRWMSLDLLSKTDIEALNNLEAQAHDPDGRGPAILMIKSHQVVQDRWICLVEVQDIFYQEVIPAAVLEPESHEPPVPTPPPAKTRRSKSRSPH